MLGKNFPISDYYRENIIDAVTIRRTGQWWTAALVIANPRNESKRFIALYKFRCRDGEWRVHQKLHLNSVEDVTKMQMALSELVQAMQKR